MVKNRYEEIQSCLTHLAYPQFKQIIEKGIIEEELHIDFADIQIKEEVYIQLKSDYGFIVYICKYILLYEDRKIGYYEYIVNENFDFIDEFFVLRDK